METFSHSSYPDSREIEDIHSSDDPQSTYKVKLMCSYDGKIQPRLHDNQLAYIGGDTKILSVDRGIKFSGMVHKLTSLCGGATDIFFKYQLPGEDLDTLISVTNDEDLEHMMIESDRLHRSSAKAAKLRLFLFSLKSFVPSEVKSERQLFVDALFSASMQSLESSSPPAKAAVSAENPDFLFRLDSNTVVPGTKFGDTPPSQPTVPEVVVKDVSAGLECGSEDRNLIGDAYEAFNQRTLDLKRLHIAGNNEQRKSNEASSGGFLGEYYAQKLPEKMTPVPLTPVPIGVVIPAVYLHEGHVRSTGCPLTYVGTDQPVYLLQAPALRPVTGQVGRGYYGVQRIVQEAYNPVQQPAAGSIQLPKTTTVGGSMQPKVGVAERGYLQIDYDSAGRQVYYTAPYQAAPVPTNEAVDCRQGGGAVNQDGKVANGNFTTPQNSCV
ncbi:hypothetical protein OIU76_007364 [Salix suchowensis]|nr:hypothetical protein OIU76_007364 [Salix suchowensis]